MMAFTGWEPHVSGGHQLSASGFVCILHSHKNQSRGFGEWMMCENVAVDYIIIPSYLVQPLPFLFHS